MTINKWGISELKKFNDLISYDKFPKLDKAIITETLLNKSIQIDKDSIMIQSLLSEYQGMTIIIKNEKISNYQLKF